MLRPVGDTNPSCRRERAEDRIRGDGTQAYCLGLRQRRRSEAFQKRVTRDNSPSRVLPSPSDGAEVGSARGSQADICLVRALRACGKQGNPPRASRRWRRTECGPTASPRGAGRADHGAHQAPQSDQHAELCAARQARYSQSFRQARPLTAGRANCLIGAPSRRSHHLLGGIPGLQLFRPP